MITNHHFFTAENIAAEVVIGRVLSSGSTDALTYSILTNANDLFEINNSGEISLRAEQNLDYEMPSHRSNVITVQVSNGLGMDTTAVVIQVSNVLDLLTAAITGVTTAGETNVVVLDGSTSVSDGQIENYRWEQINIPPGRPAAVINNSDTAEATITLSYVEASNETFEFRLTVNSGTLSDSAEHRITVTRGPIDLDGDGLIDIRGLTMLHNMRHNLTGTSYQTNSAAGVTSGCPSDTCRGYELLYDLDFDTDGDGTWSTNSSGDYRLDPDDHHDLYFDVAAGGWDPVGDSDIDPVNHRFRAVFNGNGHRIINLAVIRTNKEDVGLLGGIGSASVINGVGLVNHLVMGKDNVGGLVGVLDSGGIIVACYTAGEVMGEDRVGGLVGTFSSGRNIVIANYTAGKVNGKSTSGGIIGQSIEGTMTASYASQNVNGGQNIGGMVGFSHQVVTISASYASGEVVGAATAMTVGSLIGLDSSSTITASYGFGRATNTGTGTTNALGVPPVSSPAALTAANAGSEWMHPGWDFTRRATAHGGGPALQYADYDGTGTTYHCQSDAANAPAGAILIPRCGELLPGQQ